MPSVYAVYGAQVLFSLFMNMFIVRPVRLYCKTCQDTYSLPSNGNIKLYKELTCPLDGFELISYSVGPKGKGYPLCPYCYSHPVDLTKSDQPAVQVVKDEPAEKPQDKKGDKVEEKKEENKGDVRETMTCAQCPVSSCQFSMENTMITSCETCHTGMLVLDATSAPRYKVCCNDCKFVMCINDSVNGASFSSTCLI